MAWEEEEEEVEDEVEARGGRTRKGKRKVRRLLKWKRRDTSRLREEGNEGAEEEEGKSRKKEKAGKLKSDSMLTFFRHFL